MVGAGPSAPAARVPLVLAPAWGPQGPKSALRFAGAAPNLFAGGADAPLARLPLREFSAFRADFASRQSGATPAIGRLRVLPRTERQAVMFEASLVECGRGRSGGRPRAVMVSAGAQAALILAAVAWPLGQVAGLPTLLTHTWWARAPARLRRASRLCSRRLGGPMAPSRRCASLGPRRIRFPGAQTRHWRVCPCGISRPFAPVLPAGKAARPPRAAGNPAGAGAAGHHPEGELRRHPAGGLESPPAAAAAGAAACPRRGGTGIRPSRAGLARHRGRAAHAVGRDGAGGRASSTGCGCGARRPHPGRRRTAGGALLGLPPAPLP